MPEAPRDPSADSTLDEPDDALPRDDGGLMSWADTRECLRRRISPDALRRERERELETWREQWRDDVLRRRP